jgi:1-acyl-sn-glycerol-3-phosphate acyltransferase
MKTLAFKFVSGILWMWFLITSVLFTPVIALLWLLTFWFDRKLRMVHLFSCFWGAQYIWVNPFWRLSITGNHKQKFKKPAVIVCNHQSLVDILIIYSLFRHFRWTSKAENFKLPFVGWVLTANRSVRIHRGRLSSFAQFKEEAIRTIGEGNSLMIFPEGTRSRTGSPGRFREGAFLIAIESGVDVLPMVLDGSASAIPKSSWYLRGRSTLQLRVLERIPAGSFSSMGAKQARDYVQDIIQNELIKIRDEG